MQLQDWFRCDGLTEPTAKFEFGVRSCAVRARRKNYSLLDSLGHLGRRPARVAKPVYRPHAVHNPSRTRAFVPRTPGVILQ